MRQIPGWLFIVGVLALVAGTAICSVVSFSAARQFAVDLGESGVQVALVQRLPAGAADAHPVPDSAAADGDHAPRRYARPHPYPLRPRRSTRWADYACTDPRRINILLMGIDQREGETGEFNTDTMIVFSVDPVRKSVGMLSIPRDLWVNIPGYQPSRINTANRLGELNQYPGGGGPALAAAHRDRDARHPD